MNLDALAQCVRRWEGPIIAVAVLAWFVIIQPWGAFTDPDAFYHAHLSKLMLDSGALQAFPWLDLTTLGSHFVDHHYLFHVMLGPAILIFGAFQGTQLMAPFFATITVMATWGLMRHIGVRHAWILVLGMLLVPVFSLRMSLAKASPVAVGLFVITIGAYVFRKPFLLFAASVLFALSHGGWMISVIAMMLMLSGDYLFMKTIGPKEKISWKMPAALFLGLFVGLLLHPNRADLFPFLWVQVVNVTTATGGSFIQGSEWRAPEISIVLQELAPLLVMFLAGIYGMMFAMKKSLSLFEMRSVILFAFPVALTFALTLKSHRMVEYFVPTLAIWIASILAIVDWSRVREDLHSLKSMIRIVMIVLGIGLTLHHAVAGYRAMRIEPQAFDRYRDTIGAISVRAEPGDRVFHSNWDEFPLLFAADDRLKFISGLDPTFLFKADPELSDNVYAVTLGNNTTTHFELIAERTGSRFVFITLPRHKRFDEILQSDQRFKELHRDEESVAYEVQRGE